MYVHLPNIKYKVLDSVVIVIVIAWLVMVAQAATVSAVNLLLFSWKDNAEVSAHKTSFYLQTTLAFRAHSAAKYAPTHHLLQIVQNAIHNTY